MCRSAELASGSALTLAFTSPACINKMAVLHQAPPSVISVIPVLYHQITVRSVVGERIDIIINHSAGCLLLMSVHHLNGLPSASNSLNDVNFFVCIESRSPAMSP